MDDAKETKRSKKNIFNWRSLFAGVLIALLVVAGFRFITFKRDDVHYHANFVLYINGQKDEFKNFTFYEEVAVCAVHDPDDMKTRVHMHGQNGALVHVHAHAVTWGQFFDNLGYTVGDNVVATDKNVYADGTDGNELTFELNGQKVESIADRVIKSEDVLLINYGKDDDKTLQSRYDAVPRTAHQANTTADPSTCSGSEPITLTTRVKYAIGLPDTEH